MYLGMLLFCMAEKKNRDTKGICIGSNICIGVCICMGIGVGTGIGIGIIMHIGIIRQHEAKKEK